VIILGIDPGLRVTGYGAIRTSSGGSSLVEAGIIRPPAKGELAERLRVLYRGVEGLIRDVRPDVVALEKLYAHVRHPMTALLMGHARGVICLAAGEARVPLVDMEPTRVKKAVLSYGRGSKGQIQRAVQMWLGLERAPEPEDAADALAIALGYALRNMRTRQPRGQARRAEPERSRVEGAAA
jgi:crossover junction endodeoxyribonuclease RuvC